jgi:hypothetical protein
MNRFTALSNLLATEDSRSGPRRHQGQFQLGLTDGD